MQNSSAAAAVEREQTQAVLTGLPSEQQTLWATHRHTARLHMHADDDLNLWRVEGKRTKRIGILNLAGTAISLYHGLKLGFDIEGEGEGLPSSLWISHCPKLIEGTNLFLWIPFFPDLRQHLANGISVNIAFKSAHSPDLLKEGNVFLTRP